MCLRTLRWKILAVTPGKTYTEMAIGDDAHFYALCVKASHHLHHYGSTID